MSQESPEAELARLRAELQEEKERRAMCERRLVTLQESMEAREQMWEEERDELTARALQMEHAGPGMSSALLAAAGLGGAALPPQEAEAAGVPGRLSIEVQRPSHGCSPDPHPLAYRLVEHGGSYVASVSGAPVGRYYSVEAEASLHVRVTSDEGPDARLVSEGGHGIEGRSAIEFTVPSCCDEAPKLSIEESVLKITMEKKKKKKCA